MNEWRDTLGYSVWAAAVAYTHIKGWNSFTGAAAILLGPYEAREEMRRRAWKNNTPIISGQPNNILRNVDAAIVFSSTLLAGASGTYFHTQHFLDIFPLPAYATDVVPAASLLVAATFSVLYINPKNAVKAYKEEMWNYPRKNGGPTITGRIKQAARNFGSRVQDRVSCGLPQPVRIGYFARDFANQFSLQCI